jgi:IS30 family transposase
MINNKKEFKHLTFKDRQVIYYMRFIEKESLQKIADFIGKSKSVY